MSADPLSLTRREVVATTVAAGAISVLPGMMSPQESDAIRPLQARERDDTMATVIETIRPFQVNFPEADLAELQRRISATKWPEAETVTDASQGVQLATTQALAQYWATEYDWRRCEAKLNALPQFITEIDGLDIHFIHVRSRARECVAGHHHARLARLDHRAAEDHRAADQSDRAWRERIGRLPRRDPVAAGPWLLRQADGARMDPRYHRAARGRR